MTETRWEGVTLVRHGFRAARRAAGRLRDALSQRMPSLLWPPRALRDVGPGDFQEVGRHFLEHMVTQGSLRPSEAVLDIGCGPGRIALPLTGYLSGEGRYAGMDVVAKSVAWCRGNISPRYPNFSFHHADVFNRRYNPHGRIQAHEYTFPFEDQSFDFVLLTSVFTHMLPEGIQRYLHEIARMLRPEGRLFATFFLLNAEQNSLAEMGRNDIDFPFDRGVYRIRDESTPESAVALEEEALAAMFLEAGLRIERPIRFGGWSGRADGLSYQDIVLSMPIASPPGERR